MALRNGLGNVFLRSSQLSSPACAMAGAGLRVSHSHVLLRGLHRGLRMRSRSRCSAIVVAVADLAEIERAFHVSASCAETLLG